MKLSLFWIQYKNPIYDQVKYCTQNIQKMQLTSIRTQATTNRKVIEWDDETLQAEASPVF